jgi:hypothetical protein
MRLFGCADGLVSRPLLGGHGTRDGFDQRVLHMAQVGCVVCLHIMLDIGQQPGRFIPGGLDHPAVALGEGGHHARIPAGLITGLGQLFHNHKVALWVHRDEAEATSTRVVLGPGEVCVGHVLGQAGGLAVARVDDGVFHLAVDLLLRPIGRGDKAVETRQVQEETPQAKATGPDFDADQMAGNHEAV